MCAVPLARLRGRPFAAEPGLVRAHGDVYRRTHRLYGPAGALRAIAACRTASAGIGACDRCGLCGSPNSCRSRHCPGCQALTKAWLAARKAVCSTSRIPRRLHPPHDLNALAQDSSRVIYTLLRAAADTLSLSRRSTHLGGTIGVTAILHTWGPTLTQHLHLHCL